MLRIVKAIQRDHLRKSKKSRKALPSALRDRALSALMLTFELIGVGFGCKHVAMMSALRLRYALWRLHDVVFDGVDDPKPNAFFGYYPLPPDELVADRECRKNECIVESIKLRIASEITDTCIGVDNIHCAIEAGPADCNWPTKWHYSLADCLEEWRNRRLDAK